MKKIILLGLVLMSSISNAEMGSEGVGGGDLCEDRIKIIRDDLQEWINKGGHQGLLLPAQVTPEEYSDLMLEQIKYTKIICVGAGDVGYPVNVSGVAKVCRYDLNDNESKITCDYDKFQSIKESDQYILVHHEFAGLANIEKPKGSDSNYTISNQISGYLVDKIVKKLAVNPRQKTDSPKGPVSEVGATTIEVGWIDLITGRKKNACSMNSKEESVRLEIKNAEELSIYKCEKNNNVHCDVLERKFKTEPLYPGGYKCIIIATAFPQN